MTTVAPDGGWGWMVCFACFITHLLADGIFYSFGIIFIDLLDYFGETKSDTAWIVSLPPGVCFIVGPVVAMLSNKFGCRTVVIAGSVLTSASFIISTFAQSVDVLYATLGIFGGIGYGMVYLPSIVSVCQYFDKRRAMATGIAVSGTGIGVFIFGPLTNTLIDMYTWKGALLIEAALFLNCIPVGMVYVPLELSIGNNKRRTQKEQNKKDASIRRYGATDNDVKASTTMLLDQDADFSIKLVTETDTASDLLTNDDAFLLIEKREYYGSLSTENKTISEQLSFSESMHAVVRTILYEYLGLFLIAPFAVFSMSNFLYDLFYLVPNFYLPARAVLSGISDEHAAWLVSAIGISSTVSRVMFGWVFDKACVNRTCLYASVLTVCGICTAVGPQFSCFEVLLAYAIVYGLTSGMTVSLQPVLLADIIGIDKLAAAFGMCGMFGGVAELLGPPLAGWLYDMTGSYSNSFIAAGASLTLSGSSLFTILCLKKRTPAAENS